MFQGKIDWGRAKRVGQLLGAALTCLGLSACFDFEQDLSVKGSGAGAFEIILRIDPAFKGALSSETILGDQKAPVEVKREIKNGQYVQDERVTFNSLSELRVQNETLSIISKGSTFFGVGPKQLSFIRKVENAGADPGSLGMMRGLFSDRIYTFKVTLPGWIAKAYPLVVGNEKINPQVSGSTVTWKIPMARALSTPELDYQIDFYAYMNVPGNLTAERVQSRVGSFQHLTGVP